MRYPVDDPAFYDLEVFPLYFMAGFKVDGMYYQYVNDANAVRQMLSWLRSNQRVLVGFNSQGYDDPVLTVFLQTEDPMAAYKASVDIIVNGVPPWNFENIVNSVDLMPVLPGRMSLKKIGVCLGHPRLQELPVAYDKVPTEHEQRNVLPGYNGNDLDITQKLHAAILPELELRAQMSETYGIDLRSKGEATLAEMILLHELGERGYQNKKRTLNDKAREILDFHPRVHVDMPKWWDGLTASLSTVRKVGNAIFNTGIDIVNERLAKGAIDRTVFIDDRYYQMGVGGLHSIDGPGAWIPGPDQQLIDIDVASYYPNIILTLGLFPRAWGPVFLDIYKDIVARRLEAKRAGDKTTADVLKIAANGTYGKSSDPFSSLYDPRLTANVTVIGQLALLVLIEMLEGTATVVSANTDGITVLVNRGMTQQLNTLVQHWESHTGFTMEYTEYAALYQRDVNNYIAVKTDGKVKQKGAFIDQWPDLRHTPSANIIATALVNAASSKGMEDPIFDTVFSCTDINQFILTQNVSGDWTTSWNGRQLGKVLRFYKSNRADAAPIIRHPGPSAAGNEGAVADSEGCVPLEDLPEEFPQDVNYRWYVDKALEMWDRIRQPKRPGMNRWAELMHRRGLRPCMVNPNATALSRARVTYGDEDFTSLPAGWVIGTGTGEGLIACVQDNVTTIWRTTLDYPTKTRAKVKKDHGFELIYGARVPVNDYMYEVGKPIDLDEHYTPAELKKVGR